MATLHEVAEELYGLPLDAFIPTRTSRAREARTDGDRDLATAIGALPKPPAAAWAVNLLVRHRRDEVAQLIGVGELLREAQAALSGEDLRTLNRQQHQVMAAVVREAAALVAEHGQRLSDPVALQVEGTLRAAMADQAAADVVLGGTLVANLQSTGFEAVDLAGASALDVGPAGAPVPRSPARLHVVPDPGTRAEVSRSSTGARSAGRLARPAAGSVRPRPVAVPDPAGGDGAETERAEAERAETERAEAEQAEAARAAAEADAERAAAERASAELAEAEAAEAERVRREAEDDLHAAEAEAASAAERLAAVAEEVATLEARLLDLTAEGADVARRIEELTEREHAIDAESRTASGDARTARRERDRAARAATAAATRAAAARDRLSELP